MSNYLKFKVSGAVREEYGVMTGGSGGLVHGLFFRRSGERCFFNGEGGGSPCDSRTGPPPYLKQAGHS